jgi:hypothetical protein
VETGGEIVNDPDIAAAIREFSEAFERGLVKLARSVRKLADAVEDNNDIVTEAVEESMRRDDEGEEWRRGEGN